MYLLVLDFVCFVWPNFSRTNSYHVNFYLIWQFQIFYMKCMKNFFHLTFAILKRNFHDDDIAITPKKEDKWHFCICHRKILRLSKISCLSYKPNYNQLLKLFCPWTTKNIWHNVEVNLHAIVFDIFHSSNDKIELLAHQQI